MRVKPLQHPGGPRTLVLLTDQLDLLVEVTVAMSLPVSEGCPPEAAPPPPHPDPPTAWLHVLLTDQLEPVVTVALSLPVSEGRTAADPPHGLTAGSLAMKVRRTRRPWREAVAANRYWNTGRSASRAK